MRPTAPRRSPRPSLRVRRAVLAAVSLGVVGALTVTPAYADRDHRVQSGDTVSELAHRYGTSVASIVAANGLDQRATIVIGRTLTIPDSNPAAAPAPTASAPASHVVTAGDTVWAIARARGVTVDAIIQANGLGAGALIRAGQTLTIPDGSSAPATSTATQAAATAPSTTASSSTVTVRAGDTLAAIARHHGTTVAALAQANALANVNLIRVGQVLTVPGGSASSQAPTGLVGDTFLGRTYPADVVASANRHKAALLARDLPSRAAMQALIVATARTHGLDPALAQAIAYQESGFDMRAVSPADAIGVMQVIPASGEWASQLAGRPLDLLDPADNVLAGVLILRSHTRTFADRDLAIGAYYQGAAAVRRHGLYSGTVDYVRSVNALISRFS